MTQPLITPLLTFPSPSNCRVRPIMWSSPTLFRMRAFGTHGYAFCFFYQKLVDTDKVESRQRITYSKVLP